MRDRLLRVSEARLDTETTAEPAAPLQMERRMSNRQRPSILLRLSIAALLCLTAACGSGDGGITPPPPPTAPITLTGVPTPGTTLHQLALTFTVVPDSASSSGSFAITIDGTPAVTFGNQYSGTFMVCSRPLPNGVHTAHVIVTPIGGGTGLDTTFSFTTEVDAKAYLSTALPPLTGSTDALANDMNSSGVIVGTSLTTNFIGHAVTWTDGVVTELPTPDGLLADANAINTEGDITGTLYRNTSPFFSATLWVPGDTLQVLATEQSGVRINDKRQVLLSAATLYDIGSKAITNLWTNVKPVDLNSSGQAIGFQYANHPAVVFATSGLSVPTIHPPVYYTDPLGPLDQPIDLNDKGEILLDDNYWWVLGHGRTVMFGNAFIGEPPIDPTYGARINNNGQVVGLSDGSLYIWDKTTQTTQRIDAGANWTFDRISYFGDDGKILVHGTNTQNGTKAALLLTPE